MAALLRAHGLAGWRRNQALLGRPDFVFRRERVAIFVDGCFWHGCPRHARTPKSHRGYWQRKLLRNKARDRSVRRALRQQGWKVLRVWECELAMRHWARVARRIMRSLARR